MARRAGDDEEQGGEQLTTRGRHVAAGGESRSWSDRWAYVDVAAPWERGGLALDVDSRGCGTLAWGDGVAHPRGVAGFVLEAREGGAASGHFIGGPDAPDSRGGSFVLRLNDDGTLTAEWDDSPLGFCRPWLHDSARCGA